MDAGMAQYRIISRRCGGGAFDSRASGTTRAMDTRKEDERPAVGGFPVRYMRG